MARLESKLFDANDNVVCTLHHTNKSVMFSGPKVRADRLVVGQEFNCILGKGTIQEFLATGLRLLHEDGEVYQLEWCDVIRKFQL